ncbi:carboxymuconolactone decarboxylase family protein [Streptomyces sp. NPDC021020]|uniref:carboxymuconolactone decarboxylase family protein n=1 Tax=Streptomyces sp. NPDC021020 TaxID=3365109 RepID=UPI0037B75195
MGTRINALGTEIGQKLVKHMVGTDRALRATQLPPALRELVNIRASQLNGCGGCLDMHVKEAAAAGETTVRLSLVAAWRETTVFTEAERAALELTEHGTRLADSAGVPDAVWDAAAKHFDEEQLVALVGQIALINAFNRLNVIIRQPGGDYVVGQVPH